MTLIRQPLACSGGGQEAGQQRAALDAVAQFPRLLWRCPPEWKNDPVFIKTSLEHDHHILEGMPGLKPIADLQLLEFINATNAEVEDPDRAIRGFESSPALLTQLGPEALVDVVARTPELLWLVKPARQLDVVLAVARKLRDSENDAGWKCFDRIMGNLPDALLSDFRTSAALIGSGILALSDWQDRKRLGLDATLRMCDAVPEVLKKTPILSEIYSLRESDPKAYGILKRELAQANIIQVQRFSSLAQLQRVLADQKPDGRPTVLAAYCRHDYSGAFDTTGSQLEQVLPHFRVAYVEYDSGNDAVARTKVLMTKETARAFIPGGHGARTSLGDDTFDVSDVKSLARFEPYLAPDAAVIADSCLNGSGKDRRANIGNALALAYPGRRIFAATSSFSHMSIQVMNGDIGDVSFGVGKDNASIPIETYRTRFVPR